MHYGSNPMTWDIIQNPHIANLAQLNVWYTPVYLGTQYGGLLQYCVTYTSEFNIQWKPIDGHGQDRIILQDYHDNPMQQYGVAILGKFKK